MPAKRAAAALAPRPLLSKTRDRLLHGGGELVAPAGIELVGILREADEGARELAVLAGELHRVRLGAPALLRLPSIGTLRAAVPYDIELEVIQGPIDGTIIWDLAVFA
jgi:hypothetical protein